MSKINRSDCLNVLILAEDFYPKESGGAFKDWNVAKYLVDTDDSVTVVTPRNAETARVETVNGIKIRRPFAGTGSSQHPNTKRGIIIRIIFILIITAYLIPFCQQREFDVIYSTNHLFHPIATIISIVFGLPHISYIGYSPSIRKAISSLNLISIFEKLNFRLFLGDRTVCQTPQLRDILSERYNQNVVRLDGSVNRKAIKSAAEAADSDMREDSESGISIIFVGRLVEIKNAMKLPYIVSELSSEYSLCIVGDGPDKEVLEEAMINASVDDRITLKGRLAHEKTLRLIRDSDLLLVTSQAEAYPTVVFEALALSTPVLSTPVSVLPDIDHCRLTTAELETFDRLIPDMDLDSRDEVDTRLLEQFSVERFAEDVRDQMKKEI